jgi:hypothetical protein
MRGFDIGVAAAAVSCSDGRDFRSKSGCFRQTPGSGRGYARMSPGLGACDQVARAMQAAAEYGPAQHGPLRISPSTSKSNGAARHLRVRLTKAMHSFSPSPVSGTPEMGEGGEHGAVINARDQLGAGAGREQGLQRWHIIPDACNGHSVDCRADPIRSGSEQNPGCRTMPLERRHVQRPHGVRGRSRAPLVWAVLRASGRAAMILSRV